MYVGKYLSYFHPPKLLQSIDDCKQSLDEKKKELATWVERERDLLQQFESLVPVDNDNRDYLEKVFMRKVKCYDDCGYISEDEDEYSQNSFSDSEDESECCPENYPSDLYTNILNLREKRIKDIDERKKEQRQLDILKRTFDQYSSKLRLAEKNFKELRTQIQLFEDKKYQRLNEVTVHVPLSGKQMYNWDCGNTQILGINEPVKYVIFSEYDFVQLVKRFRDLAKEIDRDRLVFKRMKLDLKRKTKEKHILEESILFQKKKCEELQILKFGQKFDIETFDKLSDDYSKKSNHSTNATMKRVEKEYEREINGIKKNNENLKDRLKKITDASTHILNEIVNLSKQQMNLEENYHDVVVKDDVHEGEAKEDKEEIYHLKKLSHNQKVEINKLKENINRLKRKEGEHTPFLDTLYRAVKL